MKQKLEVMNTAGEDITASVKSIKLTEGPTLYSMSDLDIELRNLIAECEQAKIAMEIMTSGDGVVVMDAKTYGAYLDAHNNAYKKLGDFILAHRELFGIKKESD